MKFERLDRRITLRKLKQEVNATSGESIKSVDTTVEVWAQYKASKNSRDSEKFEVGREVSKGIAEFIIRYRDGIDGSVWELEDWFGRIWDFLGEPEMIGRREGLRITAELRV